MVQESSDGEGGDEKVGGVDCVSVADVAFGS